MGIAQYEANIEQFKRKSTIFLCFAQKTADLRLFIVFLDENDVTECRIFYEFNARLENINQVDNKDERFVFAYGGRASAPAVSQLRGNIENNATAFTNQLQAFSPALDNPA